MCCKRCDGLMVEDHVIDREDCGDQYALSTWRCINCGDVVDSAINRRRRRRVKRSAVVCAQKRVPVLVSEAAGQGLENTDGAVELILPAVREATPGRSAQAVRQC